MLVDLFRSEHDTFDIAMQLATTDDERRGIESLRRQLDALVQARDASIGQFNANKLARGEKVRTLNRAEQAAIAGLGTDPGLDPFVREQLLMSGSAGEALKGIAYAHKIGLPSRRAALRHLHPDDRPTEERLIAQEDAFADDVLAFIGDEAWNKEVRNAVRQAFLDRTISGGGAIVVVLDKPASQTVEADGKALAVHFDELESITEELGVAPISAFFGIGGTRSQDWFQPHTGLATITALAAHIAPASYKTRSKRALLADLRALADTLETAHAVGAAFHIEVDI